MKGLNKVTLMGNVGSDPELKQVGENKVVSFSLATSDKYRDKQGNTVEQTEWHSISAWNGLAEICSKYVKKGDPLYLEGKITTKTYEKDGQTKRFTSIVVSDVRLISNRSNSGQGQPVQHPNMGDNQNAPVSTPESEQFEEGDDLPF